MIVYFIIASLLIFKYRKKANSDPGAPSQTLFLAGGIYFFIAGLITLLEVFFKNKNTLFDLILIILGVLVLVLIIREELKKASKATVNHSEIEKDRIRNEIISDTNLSVTDFKRITEENRESID